MAKQPSNDLAARLSQPVPNPYANRCSVGHVLRAVSPAEYEALQAALVKVTEALDSKTAMSSGYTTRWLQTVLEDAGYRASDRMIRRHCKKDCSCDT